MLTGSSQLTRGTLGGSDIRAGLCRFIPACAGNSYERKKVTEYTSVHPRLRGELLWSKIISNNAVRFIPAYAGNSPKRIAPTIGLTVHPRLRGELAGNTFVENLITWFIPAYAGNSNQAAPTPSKMPVHPRLRGELGSKERQSPRPGGSSPLTRGTHRLTPDAQRDRRFIPAYAGNSAYFSQSPKPQTVHPRLRGELPPKTSFGDMNIGSSPLTRGTQLAPRR